MYFVETRCFIIYIFIYILHLFLIYSMCVYAERTIPIYYKLFFLHDILHHEIQLLNCKIILQLAPNE